jgi:cell division protein FtsI/penicillin-binding protein 2
MMVTPLALAKAYAAIATGRLPARIEAPLPYRQPQLAHVRRALVSAVEDPEGSAHEAHIEGLAIAGKTGTAELVPSKADRAQYLSYFAGWAPADKPEVVVVVQLESEKVAPESAVPVARRLFEAFASEQSEGQRPESAPIDAR